MSEDRTEHNAVDETLRRQFESAWMSGNAGAIEDFLPPTTSHEYLGTLEELVHVEMEFTWRRWAKQLHLDSTLTQQNSTKGPPPLEKYLSRFDELRNEPILLRLVQQEFLLCSQYDIEPDPEAYCQRFSRFVTNRQQLGDLVAQASAEAARRRASEWHPGDGADTVSLPADFGNYELLELLGEGGMGVVFLARQRDADRMVALKVIRSEGLILGNNKQRAGLIDRFRKEARAAARLEHDNIVPVYDVGEVDGQHFYSMRLVAGRSLSEELASGPLENRRAAQIVEPISRAVHEAHVSGILHRDLKPSNVLIDRKTDRPLVTDFGLAKFSLGDDQLTRAGETVGTPSYMSPEQIRDSSQVTASADVYGLGATLYCCLTGRPPFQSIDAVETLRQVLYQLPVNPSQLNSAVDRDIDTICMKCLEKESSRRYDTAKQLADDLERYLNRQPILARPLGPAARTVRWCRRNPRTALLTALALSFLLLALGASMIGYWRTKIALERAKEAVRTAHATVDKYFTQVSESRLLDQPGMQPLRKELLQKALEHYLHFVALSDLDTFSRHEVGKAHFRIGRIHEEIDPASVAMDAYAKALDIQRELCSKDQDNADYREALGDTLNSMALVHLRMDQSSDAGNRFQQALDIRDDLARDDPSRENRRKLANTYMNIGNLFKEQEQLETAWVHLRSAQSIRSRLLAESQESEPSTLRDRAMGYFNLGNMVYYEDDFDLDDLRAAVEHLNLAIADFDRLLQLDPGSLDHQIRWATCYRVLGDIRTMANENDQAFEAYANARERLDELAANNPNVHSYKEQQASLLMNLAFLLQSLQQRDDANSTFESACGILETLTKNFPSEPKYALDLGVTLRAQAENQLEQNDTESAKENLRRSLKVLESLERQIPGDSAVIGEIDQTRQALDSL